MTAALVRYNFHGDDLDVVPGDDGAVHVGVRAVCNALGVDFSTQLKKLKSDPAAGVAMIATPSEGGAQETACIPLRALPLWLATIHPSKVSPAVKKKLIRFRIEAAEVLADHFIGPRHPPPPPAPLVVAPPMTEAHWELLTTALLKIDALTATVAVLATGRGTIGGLQADWITGEVDSLAALRVLLGYHPTPRAAKSWIQGRIAAASEWGGAGAKRRDMPADRYPRVRVCLAQMRSDLEAELARREPETPPPAGSAQTALAFQR